VLLTAVAVDRLAQCRSGIGRPAISRAALGTSCQRLGQTTGLARWLTSLDRAVSFPCRKSRRIPIAVRRSGLADLLRTDENHSINRIIAPDILHNPYFGLRHAVRLYESILPRTNSGRW